MLAEERRFRIREMLASQRTVTATQLIEMLGVTAATIRRDLANLESEGVLVRSHGGAVSRTSSTNFQLSYDALLRTNSAEKQAIAREAEKLVLDGETIFLEGSSTIYELAKRLQHRARLTVITNSPPILAQLQSNPNITVMSTGGDLQRDTLYLSGVWAEHVLNEIRVDKAIIGVSAIDPLYGFSTARQSESQIKKLLVKAAKTRIALADNSKFGKQSFSFVGPSTVVNTIVTDSHTDPKYLQDLKELGLDIIVASLELHQGQDHQRNSDHHERKSSAKGRKVNFSRRMKAR